MAKFQVGLSVLIPSFHTVEVDASTADLAIKKAAKLISSEFGNFKPDVSAEVKYTLRGATAKKL